jgi:hypothetical protein
LSSAPYLRFSAANCGSSFVLSVTGITFQSILSTAPVALRNVEIYLTERRPGLQALLCRFRGTELYSARGRKSEPEANGVLSQEPGWGGGGHRRNGQRFDQEAIKDTCNPQLRPTIVR